MFRSSKFVISVLGLAVTLLTAMTGHMDANVLGCITVICGGHATANMMITRKALNEGAPDPSAPPQPRG
jgi:hypothetical protein